ncbi:putative coactivator CBP, KIX domain-containing protein [Medicago truncatula]|uniref:MATH domain protein n=1 Tax=Medicago truncatula TaxID=3880 RepID=A0A072UG46_MEDTR|nr:MATH domain protein [Medicago truncatula]RHN58483.1 putative coactivator CBP, KIX domain-containing protein [Medicago truncatula]
MTTVTAQSPPPPPPPPSFSSLSTTNASHEFLIEGYSLTKGMGIGKHIASEVFTGGGYEWAIYFYPDGKNPQDKSEFVSVYVTLESEVTNVRALFELKLLDQSGKGKHKVHSHFVPPLQTVPYTLKQKGSMWGYKRFFRRALLESSDFLKNDCLKFNCTVGVVISATDCPPLKSIHVPKSDIVSHFGAPLENIEGSNVTIDVASDTTEPTIDTSDWRTQIQPDQRHRIVNKIMDTLRKYHPISGSEGLLELRKLAQRFEDKIYTDAASQSDYLRKISLKMVTMENKSQNTMANNLPSNEGGPRNNLPGQAHLHCASLSPVVLLSPLRHSSFSSSPFPLHTLLTSSVIIDNVKN